VGTGFSGERAGPPVARRPASGRHSRCAPPWLARSAGPAAGCSA